MATFNKFQSFFKAWKEGVHDFSTDQVKIALSNSLPISANTVLANITEIDYTNCSSRNVITFSEAWTSGIYKVFLTDLVLTASGNVGQFRYIILYNDSATNKELIGWYDYGSSITLASGESFTIDFDGINATLTFG